MPLKVILETLQYQNVQNLQDLGVHNAFGNVTSGILNVGPKLKGPRTVHSALIVQLATLAYPISGRSIS